MFAKYGWQKSVYYVWVAKECLLNMGGKRVFTIYGWQKSFYYIWVAKECLLKVGGKGVFSIHGWQKSVSYIGWKRSFRPRRQKFRAAKIQESMELQPCIRSFFSIVQGCTKRVQPGKGPLVSGLE